MRRNHALFLSISLLENVKGFQIKIFKTTLPAGVLKNSQVKSPSPWIGRARPMPSSGASLVLARSQKSSLVQPTHAL